MKQLFATLAAIALALTVFPAALRAQQQQPPTKEEQEKQLLEYIDQEVERLSTLLKLEYWQEFYVDSTLTHDMHAMQDELTDLQTSRVSNVDMYMAVRDKWNEAIYRSYNRFLTEEQWTKYLRNGASREQKAREKRAAKAKLAAEKLKNGGK